jgi:ABC-type transport system substrate-binding protein
MVPEGNGFWLNPDVPQIGRGLTRGERIAEAVRLLKEGGFTFEVEPAISEDGTFVETVGKGLMMPDGNPVPEMEILSVSPGYDPLRSTFAIWIERWLNGIGVPAKANLTGFNNVIAGLFSETVDVDLDMWVLGWSLSLFPDYLENFFNSRHAPENEGGFNWGGYSNPEFDTLSTELLKATDIGVAKEIVDQLQAFLADDLPYVTLFTTPILDTYRPSRVQFPYTDSLDGIQGQNGLQQVSLIK